MNFGRLEILQARKDHVDRVVGPVLVDEADGMDFRADDVAVGFAPLLAEAERRDVVDVGARGPAVAEIALAHGQQAHAAKLLRRIAGVRHALILHAGHNDVVIGAGAGLAAKIDVVHEASGSVVLRAVGEVVAAVDGPEVAAVHHPAAARTVSHEGKKKAAVARLFFERVVKEGRVEEGHAAHQKRAFVGDGALVGNDVERFAAQSPPRLGRLAVGDEAAVEYVFLTDSLRPLSFEVERIVGGEHAGFGDDFGTGFADHIVELAGLLVGVVGEVVAPHFHVAIEIVEEDVAAGADVAGILVEIDLVGTEDQRGVFDFGGGAGRAAQLVNVALDILGLIAHVPLPDGQGFGWNGGRGLGGGSGIHLSQSVRS